MSGPEVPTGSSAYFCIHPSQVGPWVTQELLPRRNVSKALHESPEDPTWGPHNSCNHSPQHPQSLKCYTWHGIGRASTKGKVWKLTLQFERFCLTIRSYASLENKIMRRKGSGSCVNSKTLHRKVKSPLFGKDILVWVCTSAPCKVVLESTHYLCTYTLYI